MGGNLVVQRCNHVKKGQVAQYFLITFIFNHFFLHEVKYISTCNSDISISCLDIILQTIVENNHRIENKSIHLFC